MLAIVAPGCGYVQPPRAAGSALSSLRGARREEPEAVQGTEIRNVDSPLMRQAGKDLLSLALMDARNHSLRWFAALEGAPGGAGQALWELGHVGWYQEHWIARNVQRQRGEHGDATHPKLASILPRADSWFDPAVVPAAQRASVPLPDPQTIRQYRVDSLETTLELLDGAADDDDALYFYRLALLHEDAAVERFAELAQSVGIDTGLLAPLPTRALRAPLLFTATRWRLGSAPGGLVPDDEKWAHEVALPEFEIDAQPVSWAQYGEFVEDGGYDDRCHWSGPGWDWVQMRGRRTPRHVAQMRQGVLQRRFGQLVRVPLTHPALHLSWFEADAWCRWAGRRLPSEAEWEAAVVQGASRGLRWGEVREWMAGTLRPYPDAPPQPSPGQTVHDPATVRAQRGASFATRGRLRHPKARHGSAPSADAGFFGFRSCAI
jgi:ergothioneine biosynthesis protein EgtB